MLRRQESDTHKKNSFIDELKSNVNLQPEEIQYSGTSS